MKNLDFTRAFLLAIAMLLLSVPVCSQGAASSPQAKDTGNKADRNIQSLARINPSTLAMEMSLPIFKYPGRGGHSFAFGFNYSSKVWRMRNLITYFYTTPIGHHRQYVTQIEPTFGERSAAGWTSTIEFPTIEEELTTYDEEGHLFDPFDDINALNHFVILAGNTVAQNPELVNNPNLPCGMVCIERTREWNWDTHEWGPWSCTGFDFNTANCWGGTGGGSCVYSDGFCPAECSFCTHEPLCPPWNPTCNNGPTEPTYPTYPKMHYVKRVHVRMPGGATTEFRKSDGVFGHCTGSQYDGNDCESLDPDNYGTFLSVDGSGMRLERDMDRSILYMPDGSRYLFPSEAIGYFEKKYLFQANEYIDSEGNRSTFFQTPQPNANAVGNQFTRSLKDTLGREISEPFPLNLINQAQMEGDQVVSIPSNGSEKQYGLKWLHLKPVQCTQEITTNCGSTESALEHPEENTYFYTSITCFGSAENSVDPSGQFPNEKLFPMNGIGIRSCNPHSGSTLETIVGLRFNPVVLAEVDLPNGQKYEFKYNQYGEITKIIYPTGSYETFKYERIDPISGHSSIAYDKTNRGVTERKVYSAEGTLQQRWQYGANFDSSTNAYKVTTIAPKGTDPLAAGAKSERYLHSTHSEESSFGFEDPLNGMIVEERSFNEDGILRARTINDYIVKGSVPTGDSIRPAYINARRDPRLSRTVTITYEPPATGQGATSNLVPPPGGDDDPPPPPCGSCGGGNPSIPGDTLVTLTKTTYDENGNSDISYFSHLNAKQTKSYHFAVVPASTSIGTTPTWATIESWFPESKLASISETDYLYDANYKARGISSLPIESRVLDSTNTSNVLVKTQTVYDESNYPIISAGTDAQWIDPQTSLRGNATTSRVWNKDTDTWIETHAQYDNFGNQRKAWDASGDPTRFTETDYSSTYNYAYPTSVTAPAPDPTDTTGTNQTSTVTTTYDFNTGLPLTVTDDFGQTTATEYDDPLLRPTRVYAVNFTAPEAQTIYDDINRTVKVRKQIDATNWDEATTFMDSLGRTVKTQAKDSQGDVFVETHYDNMGRIDRVTNPYRQGDTIYWSKTRYDEAGRAVETYAPTELANLGSAQSLGTSDFDISTVTNFIGSVVTTTDASGRKGRSIANVLGQLIRVDEPTATGGTEDADLGTLASPAQPTSYRYDVNGKMVEVTQGVQKRWFKYDSLGRLIRVRQPEQEVNTTLNLSDDFNTSGQWTAGFTYDVLGNVLTATDAKGTVITNIYDKANRVTTRIYSNEPQGITTPAVSFFYDGKELSAPQSPNYAKGKLTKVTSSVSETQYQLFDNLGRLTQSAQITDGQTYTSKYTYNLSGALVEEEYPSGRKVQNEFESDGDLMKVTSQKAGGNIFVPYVSNFSYTASGGISQMTLGNGRWETAKFNNRLQVTELGLGASATDASVWKTNYEYGEIDLNGNVDAIKNTGNIARQTLTVPGTSFVQSYKYDSLYRLTEAVEKTGATQNWIQNWSYDRYGNRSAFSQNISGITAAANPTVDVNTNRFNTGQGFTYDKNGNIVAGVDAVTNGSRSFIFNGDNKQTEVKDANSNTIGQYFYDGEGKRVKKFVPTTNETTIFVYSSGKLVAEYSTTVASVEDAKVAYTTTDHLGSPRIITDQNGQVVSRRDFMPFGEEIVPNVGARTNSLKYTNTDDNVRQKFTGYQKDTETSLDFAEARMYENRFGRFTAVDPLLASGKSANPQTFNRFIYALNDPIVFVDADGQIPVYFYQYENGRIHWTTDPKYASNPAYTKYEGPEFTRRMDDGKWYTVRADGIYRSRKHQDTTPQVFSPIAKKPITTTGYVNQQLIKALADEGYKKEAIMFAAAGAGVVIGSGIGGASYLGWITLGKTTIVTLGIGGSDYIATHPNETQRMIEGVTRTAAANPDKVENIALGLGKHLETFSAKVGGSTWQQWGAENFQTQFLEKINNAATKIHFNLDGISNVNTAIQQGARGFQNAGSVTNWELYQIYSNPEVLQRTTFYLNGVVVSNPFGH